MVGKWKRQKLEVPQALDLLLPQPSRHSSGEWGWLQTRPRGETPGTAGAFPLGPGPRAHPVARGHQLPAGLERRITLGQDLEAALEEPHVPVSQEIQALSLAAPRRPLILRGRHAAAEATSAATRKQLARGEKEPRGATRGWRAGVGRPVRAGNPSLLTVLCSALCLGFFSRPHLFYSEPHRLGDPSQAL